VLYHHRYVTFRTLDFFTIAQAQARRQSKPVNQTIDYVKLFDGGSIFALNILSSPSSWKPSSTTVISKRIFMKNAFKKIALCTTLIASFGAHAAVVNGSFETGANPWTDTDSALGSNRCTAAACGIGNGTTGPSDGKAWIWFGGTASAQTSVLSQNVVIEATEGFLLFDFWTGQTIQDASLTLSIDATSLWTVTQATALNYAAGYSTVSIPLGIFADGANHLIRWDYIDSAGQGAPTNWSLDNVRLESAAVPLPGSMALFGVGALGLAALRRRKN
jgi:hypothetical protein